MENKHDTAATANIICNNILPTEIQLLIIDFAFITEEIAKYVLPLRLVCKSWNDYIESKDWIVFQRTCISIENLYEYYDFICIVKSQFNVYSDDERGGLTSYFDNTTCVAYNTQDYVCYNGRIFFEANTAADNIQLMPKGYNYFERLHDLIERVLFSSAYNYHWLNSCKIKMTILKKSDLHQTLFNIVDEDGDSIVQGHFLCFFDEKQVLQLGQLTFDNFKMRFEIQNLTKSFSLFSNIMEKKVGDCTKIELSITENLGLTIGTFHETLEKNIFNCLINEYLEFHGSVTSEQEIQTIGRNNKIIALEMDDMDLKRFCRAIKTIIDSKMDFITEICFELKSHPGAFIIHAHNEQFTLFYIFSACFI